MDPKEYTTLFANFYKNLGIDSKTKNIVFSDNLNSIEKIKDIKEFARPLINDSYGIGTWITNDCGTEKMNMVIKLTALWIEGRKIHTAKLSDVLGKVTTTNQNTVNNYLNLIKK